MTEKQARTFSLIRGEQGQREKRVLPRFPLGSMGFKCSEPIRGHVFEIKDLGQKGLLIALKSDPHCLGTGQIVEGIIHGPGVEMILKGRVSEGDVTSAFLAVEEFEPNWQKRLEESFSADRLLKHLRPLHLNELGGDLPPGLKYWLRSDGPFELFVWSHPDGEYKEFQIIRLGEVVEWTDGEGLRTGRGQNQRDLETAQGERHEYLFEFDEELDREKIGKIARLVEQMPAQFFATEARDFMLQRMKV